jgi:hypothetical protein
MTTATTRPTIGRKDNMNDATTLKLAQAIERLATAAELNARVLEVLVESLPATREAEILGISDRTVRRQRKARKAARILG